MPVLVPMSDAFSTRFRQSAVASDARQNVAGGRWPADIRDFDGGATVGYGGLGYAVTGVAMRKRLDGEPDAG